MKSHLIYFLIGWLPLVLGGFQKDLDTSVTFPPLIDQRTDILTGHLRPLGWQHRPEGPVFEESVSLRPEQFWDQYVTQKKPVVIRGLVANSEAVEKWTDIHLDRTYGHVEVRVSHRKQKNSDDRIKMTMKEFLQGYRVDDWHLNVIMPDEMLEESVIPNIIGCGPYMDNLEQESIKGKKEEHVRKEEPKTKLKIVQLVEPFVWMSAGDTSSLLHSVPDDQMHCVLDGRKDFILVPGDQFTSKDWRDQLGLVETYPHSNEWYSKINVDKVSAYKFKILQSMQWTWATLKAGDCIYLPASQLHQVRSHGRSIASSVYFTRMPVQDRARMALLKREQFGQCDARAPLFETLSSLSPHFLWTYTHGERHLNKRTLSRPIDGQLYLLYLVKSNEQVLHFDTFHNFYEQITGEFKKIQDTLKPAVAELVSLTSNDIWNDFFSLPSQNVTDQVKVKKEMDVNHIFGMGVNLNRFVKILNIAANFHHAESEYVKGRDEL